MGLNILLTIIAGITMITMVAVQVAPSIVESVKIKKVQTRTINNQEVIYEATKRYISINQAAPIPVIPTDDPITVLIAEGYIDSKVNDNGFVDDNGSKRTYKLTVANDKGIIEIKTTITDQKAQEAFLKSFRGISKPTQDGDVFTTKYIVPNELMHGNALLMTGIPIGKNPPTEPSARYWYDTSGDKILLKVNSNGTWKEFGQLSKPKTFKLATEYSACSASTMTWSSANSYCKNLTTDDGGWRLPIIEEVKVTAANVSAGKITGVITGTNNIPNGSSDGVPPCTSWTWTTTPYNSSYLIWNNNRIYHNGSFELSVRCVR